MRVILYLYKPCDVSHFSHSKKTLETDHHVFCIEQMGLSGMRHPELTTLMVPFTLDRSKSRDGSRCYNAVVYSGATLVIHGELYFE